MDVLALTDISEEKVSLGPIHYKELPDVQFRDISSDAEWGLFIIPSVVVEYRPTGALSDLNAIRLGWSPFDAQYGIWHLYIGIPTDIADALQVVLEKKMGNDPGIRINLSPSHDGRRWMKTRVPEDQFEGRCIPATFQDDPQHRKIDLIQHLKKVKTHCVGNAELGLRFFIRDKKLLFTGQPWQFASTLWSFEIEGTTDESSYETKVRQGENERKEEEFKRRNERIQKRLKEKREKQAKEEEERQVREEEAKQVQEEEQEGQFARGVDQLAKEVDQLAMGNDPSAKEEDGQFAKGEGSSAEEEGQFANEVNQLAQKVDQLTKVVDQLNKKVDQLAMEGAQSAKEKL